MRALVLTLALLLPPAAWADDCPAPPDTTEDRAALLHRLRDAPDPATGRGLMNRLWQLWTLAPDARAQDMLDRGMRRREAYDFAAARSLFDELVAYCPDYAEGWNQRAFVAFLTGDYEAALTDLERALALAPDHVAAKSGQALTLMQMGRIAAGQTALKEALTMNPWLPERGMLLPDPAPPGQKL